MQLLPVRARLLTAPRSPVALAAALVLALAAPVGATRLIPDSLARRHGLERAWFTQVELDPARNAVQKATLHGDQLIVLTTAGVVQSLDAETGETTWVARIGNPGYPSLGPSVNDHFVGIVNGGTVYVLEKATGEVMLSRRATSAVGGGPALSERYVFVPQFSGRVDAFPVIRPRPVPWYYASAGRIFHSAVGGKDSIVWTTDRGRLYVAEPDATGVRFHFETSWPIEAPATAESPNIYAASTGGYVYAIDEQTGAMKWRHAAGFPVTKSPISLGETLFVVTDEPSLHSINTADGSVNWIAPGVAQFISASEQRVYGLNSLGNLVVLSREHGVVQSRAATRGENEAVLNEETDRLYLVSGDGLVQCFHEIGADKPYRHRPEEKPDDAPEEQTAEPKPEPTPSRPPQEEPVQNPFDAGGGEQDPFGAGGDPFGGGENPFGGAPAEEQEETPPAEENPFGETPQENPFGGGNPFGP